MLAAPPPHTTNEKKRTPEIQQISGVSIFGQNLKNSKFRPKKYGEIDDLILKNSIMQYALSNL